MGVSNLDIEFEDDEEAKAREEAERKKYEVVEDVDLEFDINGEAGGTSGRGPIPRKESSQASFGSKEKMGAAKKAILAAKKKTKDRDQKAQSEDIRTSSKKGNLSQVKGPKENTTQARERLSEGPERPESSEGVFNIHEGEIHNNVQYADIPHQKVYIGEEYRLGDELKRVAASNKVLAIEIEARIEIETTKRLTETIARQASEAKELEYKVNKVVSQIHKKAPGLKNELMMIKKILAEYSRVGREESNLADSAERKRKSSIKKKVA